MAENKVTKYFKGKVRSIDTEKHTAEVVISDESKDRYDERVLVSSFKKTKKEFMKHPVLLSSHAYRGLQNQIGQFLKLTIDDKLKEVVGVVEYFVGLGNPEADWAFVLAEKGVAAFSIGFIPKTWKNFDDEEQAKNGGVWREYEEIELLETSQVLVPANPAALQKSFDADKDDLFLKDLHDQILDTLQELEDGVDWQDTEEKEAEEETEEKEVEKEVPENLEVEEIIAALGVLITERFALLQVEIKSFKDELEIIKNLITEKKEESLDEEIKTEDEIETETKDSDGKSNEQTESLEEVIGPEKIAEMRVALGVDMSDLDAIKGFFDSITTEIKEKISVQPKAMS